MDGRRAGGRSTGARGARISRVQRTTSDEPGPDHVERGVRSKLPAHAKVQLRTEVRRVTLHEAAVVDDRALRARNTRIRVDLLGRPVRADRPEEGQGRRQAVRRPDGEPTGTIPVVTD